MEGWQVLAAILGTGTVTTVVTWLLNRRKLSADTVKVIDEAAGSAVKRAEEDNARLRAEIREVRTESREEILRVQEEYDVLREEHEILWGKARGLERDNATLTDAVRDQIGYSRRLSAEVRRLGGTVPDPPELPISLVGTHTSPIRRQRPGVERAVD